MARKVDIGTSQAAFGFPQAAVPPKAKGVGKKKGKMTREESARILGVRYREDDGND